MMRVCARPKQFVFETIRIFYRGFEFPAIHDRFQEKQIYADHGPLQPP
jgi:hypothetical protein